METRRQQNAIIKVMMKITSRDFLGGPVVKTLPSDAGCAGLTPGQRARILHASQPRPKDKTKQKQYCNKFSKEF